MRKSNFELLRLFCIFGIVVMHAMGNIDTSLSVWNTESHIFVNALFNTGVTCFILISGYFGIKFRLEKLIENNNLGDYIVDLKIPMEQVICLLYTSPSPRDS